MYLQIQDPVSGNWVLSYAASPGITTVRTTSIILGRGVSVGSNFAVTTGQADKGFILPGTVRVLIVASTADSYTYSVGYELIP